MSSKDTTIQSFKKLSPEKQALLAQRIKEKRTLKNETTHPQAEMVTGPMPMMPRLMIDYADRQPQTWWKALEKLIEIPRQLHPALIAEAVQHLIVHHDTLRLRLRKEQGNHSLFIVASENQAFHKQNLSHLTASQQDEEMEAAKKAFWAEINLFNGPTFQVVFFDLGSDRLPHLLILLHHFAVDGYSIGVLLNDFETVCKQLGMGQPVKLPTKSTSIKEWAERMQTYAQSHESDAEIAYWKSLPWAELRPTPIDHPEVHQSATAYLTETLSIDETQALVSKVPAAYQVRLLDILLTACALTYARCMKLSTLAILILHHGRSATMDGINLSRTTGCLYTSYPLLLHIDANQFLEDPGKLLQMLAEERDRVPYGGATWYWTSYYSQEKYIAWRENIKIPENIIFNYLGETKSTIPVSSGLFREVKLTSTETPTHLHEIDGRVPHSCETAIEDGQLKVTWEYFSALSNRSTIEHLMQDYLSILRQLIKTAGE